MTSKKSIPVLMVAFLLIGACADQTSEPIGIAPQFGLESNTSQRDGPVKLSRPAIENLSYAFVESNGGRVADDVNGHEIRIMPRTVNEPTVFVMKTIPGDYVVVDLTAWRWTKGQWIQITTFNSDGVRLRLSYANTGVKQPHRLRVAYLPQDSISGSLEPMPTEIDKTYKQAQANLSHFSRYTMAMD